MQKVLLAGSISDATVWMYHLPTKKCLQVFVGHECHEEGDGVTAGTFTPDGKFALSIGMDGRSIVYCILKYSNMYLSSSFTFIIH